jgi:hypothetical protein
MEDNSAQSRIQPGLFFWYPAPAFFTILRVDGVFPRGNTPPLHILWGYAARKSEGESRA